MKTVNRLAAAYLLCWVFVPAVQLGMIYRLIAVVCSVLWAVTAIAMDTRFIVRNQWYFFWVIVTALSIIVLTMQIMSLGSAVMNTLQYIIMLIIGSMALYFHENDEDFLENILTVILLLIAFFSITTTQAVLENPYAARIANSDWLADRYEGNENVGLYGYVYMCVFCGFMLCLLKQNHITVNKLFDMLAWVDIVLILIMVAFAGYSIAIASLLVGIFCVYAFKRNSPIRSLLLLFAVFILFLYFRTILEIVFDVLSEVVKENPVYRLKIEEFRSLFLYGDSSGTDVYDRFNNYNKSLSLVLNYPISGAYYWGNRGGGGHSFILDTIGRYGWIISAGVFYLFFTVPHQIGIGKHRWNKGDYIMLLISVIFLLSDPISQEMAIPFFILFPFVQTRIAIKMKENNI